MNKEAMFGYFFGCEAGDFPGKVILTPFLPERIFTARCRRARAFKGRLYSGTFAEKNGEKFAVIRCGMGDRLMGDAVILLEGTPVRDILFAGACGGLKDCRIGDLVVCENAFNGEGFTRYHTPSFSITRVLETGDMVPSDPGMSGELKSFLGSETHAGAPYRSGDIFTIGSLMAEKDEDLAALEERGFTGIDLELSAVYQAARAIGRRASGLVFVSDLPLKLPLWDGNWPAERPGLNKSAAQLARACMEFITNNK